jgi:chaperonin cofactor prefoldin
VKELNEKVEDQNKRIEELEKALSALMQEIENLKN